jgi:NADPH:quinone reductase-like Zn-dependent oxidoreductase
VGSRTRSLSGILERMEALVLKAVTAPLALVERPDPRPGADEALVALRAAALNRRDFWITRGLYPGIQVPIVLGSDGAGVVAEVGEGVDPAWRGREVVINPGLQWGERSEVQGPGFRILGMPDDGTFATHVVVPASQLYPKPAHLDWHQAAALPLAGLTAYRALVTQGGLRRGENVLITGIGGGVAASALQIAAGGFAGSVWVTSSSEAKLAKAGELGATGGVLYTTKGWAEALRAKQRGFDLIVDGAGGEGYQHLVDLAAPGGRIVSYGATAGAPGRLDLFKVFWKQLRLVGSTMGSPRDFQAMLALVCEHRLRPVVDEVFTLARGNDALARLERSEQFGKLVLDIAGR